MRKAGDNHKHVFKRESDSSKITKLMRNISPLFFMSEFLYILFLRYNDYILSTRYKAEISEDVRKNIYNILILLYFLKPFFAFLTDNVYFNINNVVSFLTRKLHEFGNFLQNCFYYCTSTVCNGKYIFFKIFFSNKYMKDGVSSGSLFLRKAGLGKYSYIDNFVHLPLNRKYYIVLSEFSTTFLLLFIYFFNNKMNCFSYLSVVFLVSSQMLLSSCVFEGIVVERCRRQIHVEKIFYISYVMCIKIFCSLILYYMYILKVSIYLLILKSFAIFVISCLCSEETLLLNSSFKMQRNIIQKSENGGVHVKNTVDLLSQLALLKKLLFKENLFKILFLLILFNSSIDTKFSMLQYGVQNYRWPHSLINYIPLVSQSSKLIGISIFQLYTNRRSYRSYAMITILCNVMLKIASFLFLYYNKSTYVSPFLFLLNIIVQNISIKILALPILLLCIEKAPLNLESTLLNIYIFCFNLSNLISKRYFMWNLILHMSKNVFIILLLSFLTTCSSLLYYFNLSLDSLNSVNASMSCLNEKEDLHLKLSKYDRKNYAPPPSDDLFDTFEKKNSSKKFVRFREENIKTEKCKKEPNRSKPNLFKIAPNYSSDSDDNQWLIIDNLKGNGRKTYGEQSHLNISNMML
ncbi:hypothetical protein PVIIG_03402 [Plasmodium vivax India VII]|uniref:Uncharacterized protein n=4 Tax=Plasmodium vivax TaxID=5855 RepID=A0A0J9TFH5_PLAVI|nr:hypothetical protein PVIIG_03402 [Plasmodium vivax India VII]KMZ87706.1 hypothetical protein PVBG_03807 [Plasmodium vivax Brazil I]KMZ94230.1 hypothetical protein PVMG_02456 [Plasmodium vivax Mauritania I]CAI7719176.1 conserved Plasmodium protein, unknown function [Plasmodium vivax]SCO66161.1 conserved Plasmodium protein, unknown function [Plasmodium vivax]